MSLDVYLFSVTHTFLGKLMLQVELFFRSPHVKGVSLHSRSLGCLDLDCNLCKQTPHRRCTSTFAGKYLSGDVLKAKCGARIRLEVIDRRTGDSVPAHVLRDTQVEVR